MFKRKVHKNFLIDGRAILEPDCDVEIEKRDIEDEDSGEDEAGYMHPIIRRYGVRSVKLLYSVLSREEYRYMESLCEGKAKFRVDYWEDGCPPVRFDARRLKHTITCRNYKSGLRKNYSFVIDEC